MVDTPMQGVSDRCTGRASAGTGNGKRTCQCKVTPKQLVRMHACQETAYYAGSCKLCKAFTGSQVH